MRPPLLVVVLTTTVLVGGAVGATTDGVASSRPAPDPDGPGWSGPGIDVRWNETVRLGDEIGMIVHASVETPTGYLLVGARQVGVGNFPDPRRAWAWHVTADGGITWATQLAGNHSKATDVIRTDTGYAVVGYDFTEGDLIPTADAWIRTLTTDGTVQTTHRIEREGVEVPRAVAQTANGSFLVAGTTGDLISTDEVEWSSWQWQPGGDRHGWMAKVTGAGQLAWARPVGGNGSLRDVIVRNGTATAVGFTDTPESGAPFSRPLVVQVTTDGRVLRNRTIETPLGGRFSTVHPTADGFLLAGAGYIVPADANTSNRLSRIVTPALTVYGLDRHLDQQWNRTVPGTAPALVTTTTALGNGTYAVGGLTNYPGANVTIATVTTSGTVLGAATVGDDWSDIVAGIHPGSDGTVVVTGFSDRGFSHVEDGWLFGAAVRGGLPAMPLDAIDPPDPPTRTTTTTSSPTTTRPGDRTTGADGPGFAVLSTILAVLITVFVRRRH